MRVKTFLKVAFDQGYKLSFVAAFTFLQFAKTDPRLLLHCRALKEGKKSTEIESMCQRACDKRRLLKAYVTSSFFCDVNEICALLENYAA
jgi:hypothetical protein